MSDLDPRKRATVGLSDGSDSAPDLTGADRSTMDTAAGARQRRLDADTDIEDTGERATAASETEIVPGADIAPDRIITLELPTVPDGLVRMELGVRPSSLESQDDAGATRDREESTPKEKDTR